MDEMYRLKNNNPNLSIISVNAPEFRRYGMVHSCPYGISDLYNQVKTYCPDSERVQYVPSIAEIESHAALRWCAEEIFGGMDIQAGCCWGMNRSMNGMEYHKSSEVVLTFDDIVLFLGLRQDITEEGWDSRLADVCVIPANTMAELYDTTLHLAPAGMHDRVFHTLILLPRGTNVPLSGTREQGSGEQKFLFMKNKWMLAHPEGPAVQRGAKVGIIGENLAIYPLEG